MGMRAKQIQDPQTAQARNELPISHLATEATEVSKWLDKTQCGRISEGGDPFFTIEIMVIRNEFGRFQDKLV